jgi:hypothetical protein
MTFELLKDLPESQIYFGAAAAALVSFKASRALVFHLKFFQDNPHDPPILRA